MRLFRFCSVFILAILLPGCASWEYMTTSEGTKFEKAFRPAVGNWTAQQVKERAGENLKITPAVATFYSQSREITLVTYTWGNFDGKNIAKTTYYGGNFLNQPTSETENVLVRDGRRDSFVFDRKGVLQWCQYLYYSEGSLMDSAELGNQTFKPGEDEEFTKKAPKTSAQGLEEKLKDLKALKDKGVITDAEYKKMREKALGGF